MTFAICMLLSYPMGIANRYVKDTTGRLLFGIVFGIVLQYQMFGPGI
jgi:hypothetical protein